MSNYSLDMFSSFDTLLIVIQFLSCFIHFIYVFCVLFIAILVCFVCDIIITIHYTVSSVYIVIVQDGLWHLWNPDWFIMFTRSRCPVLSRCMWPLLHCITVYSCLQSCLMVLILQYFYRYFMFSKRRVCRKYVVTVHLHVHRYSNVQSTCDIWICKTCCACSTSVSTQTVIHGDTYTQLLTMQVSISIIK